MASTRECFIPRPGNVFAFADYSTLELCTLSEVCVEWFGRSDMADALNAGQDLHLALAADILGISYDEAKKRSKAGDAEIKHYRQLSKVANFGLPGGLGAKTFVEYAEGYGVVITEEQATELKNAWFRKWGIMRRYFERITDLVDSGKPIPQLYSGRLRGEVPFCAAANGMFQGLAADGAKEALWLVARECYLPNPWSEKPDPVSGLIHSNPTPLFGCRPNLFIHDEIGMEVPYGPGREVQASNATERLSAVMVAAMKRWVRHVPVKAEPVMVRRWFKGAEPVRVNGIIVPSKPVKVMKNGKEATEWVADL